MESMCRIQTNAQASAKKENKNNNQKWKKDKAEKNQAFASASASKRKNDKEEKEAFITSFMESYANAQRKNDKKIKRSNKETSDSDSDYLQSFKNVGLKIKCAKIGIPTTQVIGKTTINGDKNQCV
jgi:hypothetical protein